MNDEEKHCKRTEIIERALEVFYKHGFRTTAMDKMLRDSGISKRTVYKYFASKEELIAATILQYKQATFARVAQELETRAPDAKGKILALFDLRHEMFQQENFDGCFAMNARLEYSGKHPEIAAATALCSRELEGFITALCTEAGCNTPAITAKKIMILYEGTIVYGQSQRDASVALLAKEVVASVLNESN